MTGREPNHYNNGFTVEHSYSHGVSSDATPSSSSGHVDVPKPILPYQLPLQLTTRPSTLAWSDTSNHMRRYNSNDNVQGRDSEFLQCFLPPPPLGLPQENVHLTLGPSLLPPILRPMYHRQFRSSVRFARRPPLLHPELPMETVVQDATLTHQNVEHVPRYDYRATLEAIKYLETNCSDERDLSQSLSTVRSIRRAFHRLCIRRGVHSELDFNMPENGATGPPTCQTGSVGQSTSRPELQAHRQGQRTVNRHKRITCPHSNCHLATFAAISYLGDVCSQEQALRGHLPGLRRLIQAFLSLRTSRVVGLDNEERKNVDPNSP